MAGVVDVFTGAGKVHELLGGEQFGPGFKPGLDPVFHCLDVMVGSLLDDLYGFAVSFREMFEQTQQVSTCSWGKRFELGKAAIAQGDEPDYFNLNTALHVALLAHQWTKFGELGGIAAIKRGKSR